VCASQRRRGPDNEAIEEIACPPGAAILGHNRLSVIDLSAASNNPLWDTDRRCCLIFNGEIYNYVELKAELTSLGRRFHTAGDGETILEAYKEWGFDALHRLNGMFAFALLDIAKRRLWLVRDRFGVKPLYYRLQGDAILFASTCTAIARSLGLAPNLEYVSRGARFWVYEDDSDIAPYDGMQALPPGHFLVASAEGEGRLTVARHRFYDLSERVPAAVEELATKPLRTVVPMLSDLIENAVEIRLRSDVPVGISLSGGLDSSTIAAFVAERHADVTGFCFGHPDDRDSEGPLVEQLRRKTGIKVEYIRPSTDEIIRGFWSALDAQDGPFPGGSIVAQYLVFRAVRERGVKVLLGGQGGDEIFMGYRKYLVFRLRRLLGERRYPEALGFAAELLPTFFAEMRSLSRYWSLRSRYSGGSPVRGALALPEPSPLALGHAPSRPGWVRQMEDVTRFSLPTLLRYEDRNSMGHGVESRLPFLDFRLVEMGLGLPESLKVRGGFGKWILRRAVNGRIPDSIRLARYKRGFDVNERRWIAHGLGSSIRRGLEERAASVRPWLREGREIASAFSDERLSAHPMALCEAITLAWLAERTSGATGRSTEGRS
jgi:asparagine synthase (glutamine-hydrolysing)